MIVGRLRGREFGLRHLWSLLGPALVDCRQTPLRTLARSANGLSVHQHEDRIGMRGTQDPHRQPTASFDGHLKHKLLEMPIRHEILARHRLSVPDQLYRYLARISEARSLQMPV